MEQAHATALSSCIGLLFSLLLVSSTLAAGRTTAHTPLICSYWSTHLNNQYLHLLQIVT